MEKQQSKEVILQAEFVTKKLNSLLEKWEKIKHYEFSVEHVILINELKYLIENANRSNR